MAVSGSIATLPWMGESITDSPPEPFSPPPSSLCKHASHSLLIFNCFLSRMERDTVRIKFLFQEHND